VLDHNYNYTNIYAFMDYLELEYKHVLFFYAFLRQMDLSLDRSRWTSVIELKNYYQDRISPEEMAKYVEIKFNVTNTNFYQFLANKRKKKFKLFAKRIVLSEEEIKNFYHLVLRFDIYLKSGAKFTLETEGLRVDIAKFYSLLLEPKITKSDLKKVIPIEHYGENKLSTTKELKRLVPKDFFIV